MGVNDRTNWERRLAGEQITITTDGEPDYGFYRVKSVDRTTWRTVAYWYGEDGVLRCLLDGRDLDDLRARELWPWASGNPITNELYNAIRRGEPWPGVNSVVTLSNQAPDDNSFEAIQERIDDLAREADRLMKAGGAKSQEIADQAADVANRLADYWRKADNQRKVEKQPHLDAERAVDNKWRPLLDAADIYKRLKQIVCAPWLAKLKAEKERAEAEAREHARKAYEAAQQAQREAARQAEEAARTGNIAAAQSQQRQADEAAQEAAAAAQTAQVIATTSVTVGTTGRRSVGLRGRTVVTIEDRDQVLAFFKDRAEITEALQKMAEKAIGAGINVPGVKIAKDYQAA